jgi:peroxiredoxin
VTVFSRPATSPGLAASKGDSYVMDLAGVRPEKFAMTRLWGTQCVTDGHLTWRYGSPQTFTYTETIAQPYDPTAREPDVPPITPIERDSDACEHEIVAARELFVDRWTQAADWAPRATWKGEGSVSLTGVKHRCWIVDTNPFDGVHATLWIDQTTFLVLREKYRDEPNKKHVRREWILAEIAKPPDPKLFVFHGPSWLIKLSEPGEILVGKPAPDFTFKNAEGKETSLRALKGNIVVLYFWATSTRDAAKRMKDASDWWHMYRRSGVTVLGVRYQGKHESKKDVEQFLSKNAIEFPNYMDTSRNVHKAYMADVLPTVVIVDAEGLIYQYLRNDDRLDHWESGALGIP